MKTKVIYDKAQKESVGTKISMSSCKEGSFWSNIIWPFSVESMTFQLALRE